MRFVFSLKGTAEAARSARGDNMVLLVGGAFNLPEEALAPVWTGMILRTDIRMTTHSNGSAPQGEICGSAASSEVKPLAEPGTERWVALRREIEEGCNHWPEQIATMIEEDYRQLMKDFGLR
ncbi:MAG: hypothetical protein DME22_09800 [Verrucomicrobia bacterium]|nr:MAG: hypothetical protein DME22_09800 [Verrucomicrobiota bacterium]PYJ96748.1 MAG: hypothetical protein DME23_19055 [Verrucomicrobiota bacterium]